MPRAKKGERYKPIRWEEDPGPLTRAIVDGQHRRLWETGFREEPLATSMALMRGEILLHGFVTTASIVRGIDEPSQNTRSARRRSAKARSPRRS